MLKLNLGCGNDIKSGYVNVDKYGTPDLKHDLEVFPWPWDEGSVSEVVMTHVLEHLGQQTETYLSVIKELYRVCADRAIVKITVPHPKHNTFLDDPTHVRPITPDGIRMFSQAANEEWRVKGFANTPLAFVIGVNFELQNVQYTLTPYWLEGLQTKKFTQDDIRFAMSTYNNVVQEISMQLVVIK